MRPGWWDSRRRGDSTPPAPRLHRRLPVRYNTGTRLSQAVTANISSTGLFISTEKPVLPGRDVLVNLLFPDGCVTVCGEVVWARDRVGPGRRPGFGVRLKEYPPDYLLRVQRMPSLDDTDH